ncbi:MAG: aminotransferase class I/II-fold pyridoxal phosphate-dependent enzyme [Candidatus Heimdallarchaeota archaeon]|nr:aminotransferase class I/II-fold pyridoxal phosphate-dependent enzyme [Candidatus Heimdallarchaeota archaeon]MBY8993140.1 aminotransferase class I/II-fold pyridoxal phosphate-dependent enzyme [Candidatus Heimdallarchaeota archaeon]
MTKMKNAERLNEIAPSGIRKLFSRAQGIPGVISLGIGQPNIPTPKGLVERVVQLIEGGDNYYSPTPGTKIFREGVAEQNKRDYNLDYDPNNQILATASGCEALYCSLMSFVDPGDEVLIPDPSFLTYPRQAMLAGGKPVWMKPTKELKIDTSNLQEYITDRSKAIILNFPSNPTGEIMTTSELKPIIDLAIDNDLIILTDEVYEKCIFTDDKHIRVSKLAGAYERTLLLNSFSKTLCIPGWRLGYAAGPKEMIAQMTKMHSFIVANAPSAQQNAVGKFINTTEFDVFTNKLRDILKERMIKIVKGFNSIDGFSCRKPEGSFYAFPRTTFHKDYTTSNELSETIFEKQKIVLVPGTEFGPSGEGHLRASFGSITLDQIDEVMTRLKEL